MTTRIRLEPTDLATVASVVEPTAGTKGTCQPVLNPANPKDIFLTVLTTHPTPSRRYQDPCRCTWPDQAWCFGCSAAGGHSQADGGSWH